MNVAEIIAKLRSQNDTTRSFDGNYQRPQPLPEAALADLRLPSGEPLPRDLATWLTYDGAWLGLIREGALAATPMRSWLTDLLSYLIENGDDEVDELREWIADDMGLDSPDAVSNDQVISWWIEQLPSPELADAFLIRLPSGDQDNLLMLEPGRNELRVLGFHKFIEFWWKYESFSSYLAHWFRFVER